MNDKMYEKLIDAVDNFDMVSIYHNENTEEFCIGFVANINEDDTIIQHIAPNGLYDGYILIKTASIFEIGYESEYHQKINKLYTMNNKKHSRNSLDGKNLVVSLLKLALQNNFIVSLEIQNSGVSDLQGFVLDTDDDNTTIKVITDNGNNNGTVLVDTQSISRINCDTDEEQIIKLLVGNI